MRRRTWLGLGAVSAFALAAGGGAIALLSMPGIEDGKLTGNARVVFAALSRGLLGGTLADAGEIPALLDRLDALVASLPPHAQGELSQLLALLASGAGRRAFAGLAIEWPRASASEIQDALQSMRYSSVAARQQAYQALHDLVGAAYFSEPRTWQVLGYPGPVAV